MNAKTLKLINELDVNYQFKLLYLSVLDSLLMCL